MPDDPGMEQLPLFYKKMGIGMDFLFFGVIYREWVDELSLFYDDYLPCHQNRAINHNFLIFFYF